jgi:cytoskeletal protein CcmA (bactofilin family)
MPSEAETNVKIGKSVVITGELTVDEDLTIEGHVKGVIDLCNHVLVIGPNARVDARMFAKSVIVLGEVTGTITATDKIDIGHSGSVDGDVISPRVRIAEGAHFNGFVEMPEVRHSTGVEDEARQSAWFETDKIAG